MALAPECQSDRCGANKPRIAYQTWNAFEARTSATPGLETLQGLTQIQQLDLVNTKVSDAGLDRLKGFTHLNFL